MRMGKKRKGVLRGPKFNYRHSSYIELAEEFILAAKERPEVTKIILGTITNARGGVPKVTARAIPAGLRVTVRSSCQVQRLYVYTTTPSETAAALGADLAAPAPVEHGDGTP